MTINASQNEIPAVLKELEKMMVEMVKKGLLPALSLDHIKKIANTVFDKLNKDPEINLDLKSIREDLDTRKALGIACMAECRPENKFNYNLLFKKTNDEDKRLELKNELNQLFKDVLKLTPNMSPKNRANLEQQFDALADKLTREFEKKPDLVCSIAPAFKFIAGLLDAATEYRRQLYGVDTHVTGGAFIPPQVEPLGDQLGFPNLSLGMGDSYQASMEKADPGIPDPLGIAMINIVYSIANNADVNIEQELSDLKLIPNLSSAPHPHPTGTV